MRRISARVAEMAEGIYERTISKALEEHAGSSILPSTLFKAHAVTAFRAAEEFYRQYDELELRTKKIKRYDLQAEADLKPEEVS